MLGPLLREKPRENSLLQNCDEMTPEGSQRSTLMLLTHLQRPEQQERTQGKCLTLVEGSLLQDAMQPQYLLLPLAVEVFVI